MIKTLRSVLRFRPVELDPVERRLSRAASVRDLRRIARKRLPRGVFDYIDGGAEDERTLRRNAEAFRRLEFRPRVLRDVGAVDTSTTLLGRPLPVPLVLAPTGFTRIATPGGELAVARAAARAGLPYTLSTMGTRSIEEVAAVSSGRKWFQVYVWRDRGLVKEMLGRAAAAGYRGDRPHRRHRGARPARARRPARLHAAAQARPGHPRRRRAPPRLDVGLRPRRADHVRQRHRDAACRTAPTAVTLADYINTQFDPALVLARPGLVALGVGRARSCSRASRRSTTPARRRRGRRRDRAVQSRRPSARRRAGARSSSSRRWPTPSADRTEIICDGGVRRGSDIVKAIALGATRVHGRPGVPLRPGGGRRAGSRPCPGAAGSRRPADHGAHRPSHDV